jgi:hypothetical protein
VAATVLFALRDSRNTDSAFESINALIAAGPTTLSGAPGSSTVVPVQATKSDGTPVNGVLIAFQVQLGGGGVEPVVATTAGDQVRR